MTSPAFFTALITLFATAVAQTEQVTWAAVSFAYHGEMIPHLHSAPYYLTPHGANQMLNAAQAVRQRYISPPTNASLLVQPAVINGISTSAIDNSQLYILGTDDIVISQSMQAFMQGLYPPRTAPTFDQQDVMADGTLEQYPLGGYQYPAISAVSELDFNYISVDGNTACTANDIFMAETLSSDAFTKIVESTGPFYTSLSNSVFKNMPIDILNYGNAWDLYEYALFEYMHTNVTNATDFTVSDLELLNAYASAQQWTFNTPSGISTIQAMAGRTLASKVLEQFSHNIDSSGSTYKLSLLFGTYEPFLSFFALSDLATGPSASKFNSLPLHGSLMTFELYSYYTPSPNVNLSTPFPAIADLRVRFLFRNGTAGDESLVEYTLFGRGNSQADMSWSDFVQGMGQFSLDDLVDWCTECNTALLFCEALENNQADPNSSPSTHEGNPSGRSGISPVVAGVIGATVTVAAMIIAAAALMLFGFRLEHREKNAGTKGGDLGVLKRSGSGNGGFKGAEKLASDTDLRLKGGAGATIVRHERVGSWELTGGPSDRKHTSLDKEIESAGITRKADYERHSEDDLENVNPFGDPVKAVDQV